MGLRRRDKPPNDSNKTLHDWGVNLLQDGQEQRRAAEAQWWENLATYSGDFWAEYDVILRELVETKRENHKVRLPVNLAQPVVRTEYAKLIKNRPIIDVLARSNDQSDLNAAEVGDKVLNHYCEKQFHMPKVRRRALQWVLLTGFGGIFVDYDATLLGETEVLVDPAGTPITDEAAIKAVQRHYRDKHKKPKTMMIEHGDLRVKPLSPWQIIWDSSEVYFEDAAWCIFTEVYDVDEVWRRWDVEVDEGAIQKPSVMHKRLLERFDITGTEKVRIGKTQRLVEVHRLFVKPGHRYFEDGAEIVFTEKELIEVAPFPHTHGELPGATMGHIPFPISQHPQSVLQQIKPVVLELSKTASQMIENRNLMANPPWIEYRQNRIKGPIQNKPGMRLLVDYMPNLPDPHPIEMPDLPAYVKDLVPIFKETILEMSGQGETSQGKVPAGARSGVAIAYLQEEDDTKLGPTVMEYEEMIERVAGQMLLNIAQYYDAPRTIRIFRKHSEPEVFDFIGTMLSGVAGVQVQAGSALPRSKAAKQQFILDLWDRKLEQDPRKVREMLELSEGDPDEWEIDLQQAERELLKLKKGEQVPVLEWYNHAAHHYVLRRYMKSADFEADPKEIQDIMQAHDEEHSRFEQQQQMSQLVQQQMMGGGGGGGSTEQQPPPGGNGANAVPQPPFTSPTPNGSAPADLQTLTPE
jgi:hypothetical protein